MASKRKYNQWQNDPNLSIPKRTLARLKKSAGAAKPDIRNFEVDICGAEEKAEDTRLFCAQGYSFDLEIVDSQDDTDDNENFDELFSENKTSKNNDFAYENLNEPCHLVEDSEFRDNNIDGADIFQSESDSSDEDDIRTKTSREYLYPGWSLTIQDSILSIMKYSLRHKTTYAALSDLLSLLILHLPTGSHKEHLQSLYFLKKAFIAQTIEGETENPDIAKIHEYCPNCMATWKDNEESCRFCTEVREKRSNNYFLTLEISTQLQTMFRGMYNILIKDIHQRC